jgi:hypothetical protein
VGVGPATASSGHYQLSPGFTEDGYDVPHTDDATSQSPGGSYAYSLVGEGYVYEMAIPWGNFHDLNGSPIDRAIASSRPIGFDVCIIDQDKNVTTARQRAVWCQDGKSGVADEAWNNMDGAGTISIGVLCCEPYLGISSTAITLSAKAGSSDSVTVSSSNSWTAVSDQSWLAVSPSSHSKGNATLTFTATANTGASRSAKVTVSGGGIEYITVTQEANGVCISTRAEEKVKISPNPATDRVTIQGGIDRVELYNSLGIKVKEIEIKRKTFSVANLPDGIYILKAFKNQNFAGVANIIKN